MEGEAFDALVNDIKENGQRIPILVEYGTNVILDGRNRYLACKAAGVTPDIDSYVPTEGAVSFIMSLNVYRRHLTPAQKKKVFLAILPMYEAEAKERQRVAAERTNQARQSETETLEEKLPQAVTEPEPRAPQATDKAAAAVGISGRTGRN